MYNCIVGKEDDVDSRLTAELCGGLDIRIADSVCYGGEVGKVPGGSSLLCLCI